jgi:hypothetical protein
MSLNVLSYADDDVLLVDEEDEETELTARRRRASPPAATTKNGKKKRGRGRKTQVGVTADASTSGSHKPAVRASVSSERQAVPPEKATGSATVKGKKPLDPLSSRFIMEKYLTLQPGGKQRMCNSKGCKAVLSTTKSITWMEHLITCLDPSITSR